MQLPFPWAPAPASMVAPPTIRVTGASLHYHGHAVFEDLDAEFAAGSWTCVLGPSGTGKSSLLRVIAGLAADASGTVTTADGAPIRGLVGFMDQRDLLLPWLNAIDNVLIGARLRGEHPDEERAAAVLAAVGLGAATTLRPAELSGGMRQRVALARTLMEDRPVVLMDEPFTAVDALTRIRLQELARTMLAGRTVIMVTHDPWEALRLADCTQVMTGTPARLLAPAVVPGLSPRDITKPSIVALYRDLLAAMDGAP